MCGALLVVVDGAGGDAHFVCSCVSLPSGL